MYRLPFLDYVTDQQYRLARININIVIWVEQSPAPVDPYNSPYPESPPFSDNVNDIKYQIYG